ncbi:MAG TPA: GNAT family N-acetyltransferase [Allosphingosinicella sp.]|nr:GNAT family N-acetyltransferase [Allosphingosinicella sp.]
MRLEATPDWSNETVRLFLLTPDAVSDAYVGWLADPMVNRYLESRFSPQPREVVEAFVADMLASEANLLLGIHSHALDAHVGNIKLGPIDRRHGLGEIGIMIGEEAAWGRGIGSAALRALEAIALSIGVRRLTAGCYASNVGSRRAFEKVGFAVEGRRNGHYLLDGRPEDGILLGKIIAEVE